MTGNSKNILCILSEAHHYDKIVSHAMQVAQYHEAQLTILLKLDALPPNANMVMQSFAYLETHNSMESAAKVWMDKQVTQWSKQYPVTGTVAVGQSSTETIQYIMANDIDLVIKLSDADDEERLCGSDDMELLRKCPCPVWVVPRGDKEQYDTIVAALDLNYHYPTHEVSIRRALNKDILRYAAHIALMESAQLRIVHVFDAVPDNILRGGFISVDESALQSDLNNIYKEREEELERLITEIKAELKAQFKKGTMKKLRRQKHLVHGYPRREIAATATAVGAKAVVMGTVARLGVPGFIMGGTAEETLQQLTCPVIGIKPEGFVSPVTPLDTESE